MPNMSSEKIDPSHLMDRMVEFGESPIANYFIFEGPLSESERLISVAIGIFPPFSISNKQAYIVVSAHPDDRTNAGYYHTRIRELNLSQRIIDLGIPDFPEDREKFTRECRINGWPIIAIFFGQYADTNEEFTALSCIAGISPQTALKKLKKQSQERLISFQ